MGTSDTTVELMRDFLLGFIKIHILYHAKQEKIYGKEFHEELNRHGYNMSFGTLYPIFHKLEKDGYLTSEKVNINGKIRKYYTITKKGRSALADARQKANELVKELSE
jgi:PadR family transcriptional regulator, regulatory protein PadR